MPGAGLTVYLAVSTLEYLVVAFFLLGITIFLLLQSRHFKRMESSAGRAFRNQELLDELVALRKAVRPMDFDMGALEDKLDELVQSNVRVEERLLQLNAQPGPFRHDDAAVGRDFPRIPLDLEELRVSTTVLERAEVRDG